MFFFQRFVSIVTKKVQHSCNNCLKENGTTPSCTSTLAKIDCLTANLCNPRSRPYAQTLARCFDLCSSRAMCDPRRQVLAADELLTLQFTAKSAAGGGDGVSRELASCHMAEQTGTFICANNSALGTYSLVASKIGARNPSTFDSNTLLYVIIGVAALALVVCIVVIACVVSARRRSRRAAADESRMVQHVFSFLLSSKWCCFS